MEKIILYYKFVPVNDPEMTKLWQKELCDKLGLKGRIIISKHGINGTLGGDIESLREYKRSMNKTEIFKGIPYKWSEGRASDFPRLSVKVRPEIVAFGVPDEIEVDSNGVIGGGKHLKPEQLHALLKEKGEDVVFFDGRNAYEAQIGKFKNAVVPDVETSKDFIKEIEDPKYNDIKDKPVVTYCTGGIRCEILSSLMKNRGFKDVYQIDGGIVKYGEKYPNDGEWEGKLYIFDNRMVTSFSDDADDIGKCVHCENNTSNFVNCSNKQCNKLILVCESCVNDEYCPSCVKSKIKSAPLKVS
jgi:UPF0176 protein